MTSIAARKQARRFYGTMGAAMRRTSRWMDVRGSDRTDVAIRHAFGCSVDHSAALTREAVAR
jgi:hypothetical protein